MKIEDALMKAAAELYDDRLAYHNFSHIDFVLKAADTIVERCRRYGVTLNEDVVYIALLFHDAGFFEDHTALGYDSKEAYSAELAARILADHGFADDTIAAVRQAILGTRFDGRCTSNEDRAVRMADLSGLAADYEVFLDNAVKLRSEYELLTGDSIDWDTWKNFAVDRLMLFIREDMELTDEEYDESGESLFRQAVLKNVERLRREPAPE